MNKKELEDRKSLAMSMVKEKGILTAHEVRRLSECGVPVISSLMEFLQLDANGVCRLISDKEITYDILVRSLFDVGIVEVKR